MDFTIRDIISLASDLSVIGLLLVILWGGHKQWWVFGWIYQESEKRSVEWKQMALRGTNAAEKAVTLATKASGLTDDS